LFNRSIKIADRKFMKKILYTKFKNIDDIIADLMKNAAIRRAVTRSNLYKFWGKVAGEKFAQHSKPFSMIKGSIMVIACETPTVAQELMLRKTQLLVKFKPYVESLNMKLTDLRFDSKKWKDERCEPN
jgi:tRNA A37 N6-isopentenylltransferase MiaA